MKFTIIGLLLLTMSLSVQATPLIDQPIVLSKPVGQRALLDQAKTTIDLELAELHFEINAMPEKRCRIRSTTRIVERNLIVPYHQQTLYGSNPCQFSK